MRHNDDCDIMLVCRSFLVAYPGFLSVRDQEHRIVYLNDNFRMWLKKYTDVEPIGMTNKDLSHLITKNIADVFLQCHDLTIEYLFDEEHNSKIIQFNDTDINEVFYFHVKKFKINLNDKDYIFTIGQDVTLLCNERNYFKFLCSVDDLTGLQNRVALKNYRNEVSGLFILIDLDNFKWINDSFGHDIGDAVLVKFANILRDHFRRADDILIRYGGDEFLIIAHSYETVREVQELLSSIRQSFESTFSKYKHLDMSIGCGFFVDSIECTLRLIDEKMYMDKKNRKTMQRKGDRLDVQI